MLTEPNVLQAVESHKRSLRPNTSLSSSVIGTIGVGGGVINTTCDSQAKELPASYISQRHQDSFYSQTASAPLHTVPV